jgi:hypothetical protein
MRFHQRPPAGPTLTRIDAGEEVGQPRVDEGQLAAQRGQLWIVLGVAVARQEAGGEKSTVAPRGELRQRRASRGFSAVIIAHLHPSHRVLPTLRVALFRFCLTLHPHLLTAHGGIIGSWGFRHTSRTRLFLRQCEIRQFNVAAQLLGYDALLIIVVDVTQVAELDFSSVLGALQDGAFDRAIRFEAADRLYEFIKRELWI